MTNATKRGMEVLHDPRLNKSTGFTEAGRQALGLVGRGANGMAIYATKAKRMTDEMFIEAAHAVADQVTPGQLKLGMLFPPQSNIVEVEIQTTALASLVNHAGSEQMNAIFKQKLTKQTKRKDTSLLPSFSFVQPLGSRPATT